MWKTFSGCRRDSRSSGVVKRLSSLPQSVLSLCSFCGREIQPNFNSDPEDNCIARPKVKAAKIDFSALRAGTYYCKLCRVIAFEGI